MTRGERVIAFIERYCRAPEGKMVGQPIVLEPFQRRFILAVYDNPAGTSEGILSMARKNGKTALIAAIMLAHLVGPEAKQNSQIVSGARARKQAAQVFKLAHKMVMLNPDLQARVRAVPSDKMLVGLAMNTEYQALSAEAGTAHGLSPVLAIQDELGQVRGPQDDFVEAIETAQGAYDDALRLTISTQAPTDNDMLSIRIDDAIRSNDPKIVVHLYAAEPGCDVLDRAAHEAANPALGSFRSESELNDAAAKAARMPSFENSFRNLYLNQRVNRFSPFVSPGVWAACGGAIDLDVFSRRPCYGGLDLSQTTDLTAFVLGCEDEEACWHYQAWFWKPEATLADHAKRYRVPYDVWAGEGFLETTPGVAIGYDFVAQKIGTICAGLDLKKLAFDRYKIDEFKRELARADIELPLEPYGQGFASMSTALQTAEIDFLNDKVRHGNHPVLTMCAANAVVQTDAAGNRKLDKAKSTGRIDGMVALVMARGVAAKPVEEGEGPSVYETRGVATT